VGCHILAVSVEEIVKKTIAALALKG